MAKMIVKQIFADKFTGDVYQPGVQIEVADASRIEDLETRGLASVVECKKAAEPAETKKPVKKSTTTRAKK